MKSTGALWIANLMKKLTSNNLPNIVFVTIVIMLTITIVYLFSICDQGNNTDDAPIWIPNS